MEYSDGCTREELNVSLLGSFILPYHQRTSIIHASYRSRRVRPTLGVGNSGTGSDGYAIFDSRFNPLFHLRDPPHLRSWWRQQIYYLLIGGVVNSLEAAIFHLGYRLSICSHQRMFLCGQLLLRNFSAHSDSSSVRTLENVVSVLAFCAISLTMNLLTHAVVLTNFLNEMHLLAIVRRKDFCRRVFSFPTCVTTWT